MAIHAAIVGGTGIGELLAERQARCVEVSTAFGPMCARILEHGGREVALISRHSEGHKIPPHKVNYRAIALGVKALGATACFSSAAVGSLREDWPQGLLAVCSDFIDISARNLTLFESEVAHTDFSEPFHPLARSALLDGAKRASVEVRDGAVYVNANGPRYETPFEVRLYRQFGGDVVGMTAASEAIAMKEAGVPYACLAVVTNLACGIGSGRLDHGDVVREMTASGKKALDVLFGAVEALGAAK